LYLSQTAPCSWVRSGRARNLPLAVVS